MTKHKTVKLNMRSQLLKRLLFCYLSGNAPTRASVSERCQVSKVTSGKVAHALIESKIMCERVFSLNGKSPCAHLFVDDGLNIMVIDLSSPTFKMTLFDANATQRFNASHSYDTSESFDDNMNIFLSRCGLKAKQSGHSFSAISVIYADEARHTYLETVSHQAILPSIKDKERITQSIFSIFHKNPISHLTVSEAICEAMKFEIPDGVSHRNGVSYIFIGNIVASFHVHTNGSITVCSPQNIVSDVEKEILFRRNSAKKDELDSLFIKLTKFMTSAFSPSTVLYESDRFLPDDETAKKLIREFASIGINPPIIRYKNDDTLFILGAIRNAVFSLAIKFIIT